MIIPEHNEKLTSVIHTDGPSREELAHKMQQLEKLIKMK